MAPKRILIVDDEIGSTRLLKANLELTGRYTVRVENQPENALAVARHFKPQLFLLDIVMPNLSGTQLAAILQADPELTGVPIAFLSAAPPSLLPRGSYPILHGRPCISKPACMEEILQFLEQILPLAPVPGLEAQVGPVQLHGATNEQ
jgi:CheY-like chemotaxis protein